MGCCIFSMNSCCTSSQEPWSSTALLGKVPKVSPGRRRCTGSQGVNLLPTCWSIFLVWNGAGGGHRAGWFLQKHPRGGWEGAGNVQCIYTSAGGCTSSPTSFSGSLLSPRIQSTLQITLLAYSAVNSPFSNKPQGVQPYNRRLTD